MRSELLACGPNVIGATGGSGTRVLARIARRGGMFTGTRLNESEDAIDFGDYSDRWVNAFVPYRGSGAPPALLSRMTRDLESVLESHCAPLGESVRPWGWKEPRSIYLLPFLHEQFPSMRFLHVVRDGRDMAFSANQNQLRKHGPAMLKWSERLRGRPFRSITLWSRVNLWAAEYGESRMSGRYLRVRFEDLCDEPAPQIERIFGFFGLSGDARRVAELEVSPPRTLGRWREARPRSLTALTRTAHPALEKFGYLIK